MAGIGGYDGGKKAKIAECRRELPVAPDDFPCVDDGTLFDDVYAITFAFVEEKLT